MRLCEYKAKKIKKSVNKASRGNEVCLWWIRSITAAIGGICDTLHMEFIRACKMHEDNPLLTGGVSSMLTAVSGTHANVSASAAMQTQDLTENHWDTKYSQRK